MGSVLESSQRDWTTHRVNPTQIVDTQVQKCANTLLEIAYQSQEIATNNLATLGVLTNVIQINDRCQAVKVLKSFDLEEATLPEFEGQPFNLDGSDNLTSVVLNVVNYGASLGFKSLDVRPANADLQQKLEVEIKKIIPA